MSFLNKKRTYFGNVALVVFLAFVAFLSAGLYVPAAEAATETQALSMGSLSTGRGVFTVQITPVTPAEYSSVVIKLYDSTGTLKESHAVTGTVYGSVYTYTWDYVNATGTQLVTARVYLDDVAFGTPAAITLAVPPSSYTPPAAPSGGGGSSSPAPVTPTPTPTPTPTTTTPPPTTTAPAVAAPVAIGAGVSMAQNIVTAVTTAPSGIATATATVNATQALAALAAAPTQVAITVPVTMGANAQAAQAVIPQTVMAALASKAGGAVTVQASDGALKGAAVAVPAAEVNVAALAQQMGTTVANVSIAVTITPAPQATVAAAQSAAKAMAVTAVAPMIDFSIQATSTAGQTVALTTFATYVPRAVPLPQAVVASNSTGVRVEGNTLVPVPTRFTTVNGQAVAEILSNTTSVYTVVANNKSFNDLTGNAAKADIEILANKLIISGMTDKTFVPEGKLTRAQFAALVTRALGLKASAFDAAKFKDVKSKDWFAGAVGGAVKAGIIKGYSDGTFKPNANVSNEEMVAMLVSALKLTGTATTISDADAKAALAKVSDQANVSAWAKNAVAVAAKNGIVKSGALAPSAQSTRAQAAVGIKGMLTAAKFI